MPNLGPGTLKFGPSETAIDASCLVNNARIEMSKDQDDPKYKLCGTATPGKITYTYALTGNLDTDTADAAGLFAYSQAHAGEQVDFEFIPNTAAGTSATGVLTIDPLDFGGDEYGAPMDSDFEFSIVGKPNYVFAANRGSASPGDIFPPDPAITASDATNAAKLAGLGFVADPVTAWLAGQKMTVGTFDFNWSGTAWAAGAHA